MTEPSTLRVYVAGRTRDIDARRSAGYARRDMVVCLACNLLMRLASRQYRDMVGGAIQYGLDAAVRDRREGREPPGRGAL